jgi:hypothetical protein
MKIEISSFKSVKILQSNVYISNFLEKSDYIAGELFSEFDWLISFLNKTEEFILNVESRNAFEEILKLKNDFEITKPWELQKSPFYANIMEQIILRRITLCYRRLFFNNRDTYDLFFDSMSKFNGQDSELFFRVIRTKIFFDFYVHLSYFGSLIPKELLVEKSTVYDSIKYSDYFDEISQDVNTVLVFEYLLYLVHDYINELRLKPLALDEITTEDLISCVPELDSGYLGLDYKTSLDGFQIFKTLTKIRQKIGTQVNFYLLLEDIKILRKIEENHSISQGFFGFYV